MTKTFKESLREILYQFTEPGTKYLKDIEDDILKLISEYAPPDWSEASRSWNEGYSAGIKAYKQALGVDE